MPYINVKTSCEINDAQKEVLKSELAEIMQKVADKSEDWLMVSFNNETIFFKGEKCAKAAFVEIKLVGSISSDQKTELSRRVCKIMDERLGIPPQKLYLVITCVSGENWGWNCNTF